MSTGVSRMLVCLAIEGIPTTEEIKVVDTLLTTVRATTAFIDKVLAVLRVIETADVETADRILTKALESVAVPVVLAVRFFLTDMVNARVDTPFTLIGLNTDFLIVEVETPVTVILTNFTRDFTIVGVPEPVADNVLVADLTTNGVPVPVRLNGL